VDDFGVSDFIAIFLQVIRLSFSKVAAVMAIDVLSVEDVGLPECPCVQYCPDLYETFGTNLKLYCNLILSHLTLATTIHNFLSVYDSVKFQI
jgi:hypothetical protein